MAIQTGAQAFLMHARPPPFTIPEPRGVAEHLVTLLLWSC